MSEVIERAVSGVSFGLYRAEELLQLSVCALTNPHTFDSLHQPVPGGLYDERMGPLDVHDRCRTCGLPQPQCMGHLGHIQLTLPVYQPLLFDLCFKLLRAQCWACDRLKLSHVRVQRVSAQLQLIEAGMLAQAQQLDSMDLGTGDELKQLKQAAKEKAKAATKKITGKHSRKKKMRTSTVSNGAVQFIDGEAEDEDEESGE